MDQTIKRKRKSVRFAAVTLFAVLAFAPAVRAQQPPEPPAGFVPADSVKPQEQLPAAPLVLGAYAVAWVGVFGYLWSIWSRLGRVEREIADVNRRLAASQRR